MRFREYIRLVEEIGLQDVVILIVRALGANPDGDNYEAKLTQFAEPSDILDKLNALPALQTLIQNKPAALTAVQNNPNLTVGQFAGILVGNA